MAKALYGHMASPDHLAAIEIARLRRRVAELEAKVEELQLERSLSLSAALEAELLEPVPH